MEKFIYLPKLSESNKRPFWSVIIPTYNCATFLEQTLDSVLQQDPGQKNMEIIVIDDHSTKDDPELVVNQIGGERVNFIRQKENVGKVRNFESALLQCKGQYIHILHGDDKVRDGFYEKMENLFDNNPTAKAGFCRSIYIDENNVWTNLTAIEKYEGGIIENCFDKLVLRQCIQTPSMVVKREVYEDIGIFHHDFDCMEDWEMWLRIAYNFPIAFCNEVLAEYRVHRTSTSSFAFLNGNFIKEHSRITSIIKTQYMSKTTKNLLNQRNKEYALYLFNSLKLSKVSKSFRIKTIWKVFMLSKNPKYFLKALL